MIHVEEEQQGTRLMINALTVLLSKEADPSKLISSSPGKLVRCVGGGAPGEGVKTLGARGRCENPGRHGKRASAAMHGSMGIHVLLSSLRMFHEVFVEEQLVAKKWRHS